MAVKIERIEMHKGGHLYIKFGDSHEHQVCIVWNKGEPPYIQGPMNKNSEIIYIKDSGLVKKEGGVMAKTNPTIEEIERILTGEDEADIEILPSGEIREIIGEKFQALQTALTQEKAKNVALLKRWRDTIEVVEAENAKLKHLIEMDFQGAMGKCAELMNENEALRKAVGEAVEKLNKKIKGHERGIWRIYGSGASIINFKEIATCLEAELKREEGA